MFRSTDNEDKRGKRHFSAGTTVLRRAAVIGQDWKQVLMHQASPPEATKWV